MSIESKKVLNIKTAGDYHLTDDPFLNGLMFLDACGCLNDFFDKIFGAWDAFNEDTLRYTRGDASQVNEEALDSADRFDTDLAYRASLFYRYESYGDLDFTS